MTWISECGLARRGVDVSAQSAYPTHAAYVEAIGAAMQQEYEAIVNAGFVLQLDCPDLAMARHTGFQDLTEAEFLKARRAPGRGDESRAPQHSGGVAPVHLCWGNYEGPHDFDIPLEKIIPIILKGKPSAIRSRPRIRGMPTNGSSGENARIPDDKILIPGVLTRPPITSSIPSWSHSGSASLRTSSGANE